MFARAANEDPDTRKILADVVLYKIDAEKDAHGPTYARARGVKGYPTFIMLNAGGETMYRWLGYEKEFFAEMMSTSLADRTTISQKEGRFAAKPTEADAVLLARYQDALGEYSKSASLYRRAGELAGPAGPDHAMAIFSATMRGATMKEPVFTADEVRAAGEAALRSPHTTTGEVMSLARRVSSFADRQKDPELAIPYLRVAEERSRDSSDEEIIGQRAQLMPLYALNVEKDKAKAVEYKRAAMPDGWMEDSGGLNEFAWWCFENQVNLAEAKTLAAKGVELAPAGSEKAQILDTEAEICNALGDCKQAVELTRRAIAEDPDNQYYQDQLARFEELLAKQS